MEEDERKGAGRCGDFTSRYNSNPNTDTHRFPLSDVINMMRIHALLMSYSILALRPHLRPPCASHFPHQHNRSESQ